MTMPPRRIDPRWRKAAGALLAWGGFTLVLYSPMLPAPSFLDIRLTLAALGGLGFGLVPGSMGVLGLVAGAGAWFGRSWGRSLGVVACLVALGYQAWVPLSLADPSLSLGDLLPGFVLSMLLPLISAAVVLFVLLRRWDV